MYRLKNGKQLLFFHESIKRRVKLHFEPPQRKFFQETLAFAMLVLKY